MDWFRQSFTIKDTYFANYAETAWKEFKNSREKIDRDQQSALRKYVLGGPLACSFSWTEVNHVYIPVNAETLKLWILLVLDLSTRTIMVYNSLKGDEDNDSIIREKIEPVATLLSILLDFFWPLC
ncbi:Ulp1 protease family, C-terminal catalytic domain containing protein [Trema orientale]|uniref:Ulp1 protease family, C-terminal catalytic domain containing protein n=1 Tax=Trema orientale TaxID=63057 RepID=A0A2P5F3T6_TREOI|nr:Ulp1 protease family, C-terminal catalytic domain containing protein [Trema orientale]